MCRTTQACWGNNVLIALCMYCHGKRIYENPLLLNQVQYNILDAVYIHFDNFRYLCFRNTEPRLGCDWKIGAKIQWDGAKDAGAQQ